MTEIHSEPTHDNDVCPDNSPTNVNKNNNSDEYLDGSESSADSGCDYLSDCSSVLSSLDSCFHGLDTFVSHTRAIPPTVNCPPCDSGSEGDERDACVDCGGQDCLEQFTCNAEDNRVECADVVCTEPPPPPAAKTRAKKKAKRKLKCKGTSKKYAAKKRCIRNTNAPTQPCEEEITGSDEPCGSGYGSKIPCSIDSTGECPYNPKSNRQKKNLCVVM